jgi:hypothetical protein
MSLNKMSTSASLYKNLFQKSLPSLLEFFLSNFSSRFSLVFFFPKTNLP